MPEKEKKNDVLSLIMGVFGKKKESYADIVTQADKVVADYILKRRNEIIDKYCKNKKPLFFAAISLLLLTGLVIALVL